MWWILHGLYNFNKIFWNEPLEWKCYRSAANKVKQAGVIVGQFS